MKDLETDDLIRELAGRLDRDWRELRASLWGVTSVSGERAPTPPEKADLEADEILEAFRCEFERASQRFQEFPSLHHGYAVLLEEVDELWQAIKHGEPGEWADEAIQVGAMALRILYDGANL